MGLDTPMLRSDGEEEEEPVHTVGEEPPYSVKNEISFFFNKGIPLGLSALLEWGAPPWFAMYMAGQTHSSAKLQSALGYAQMFFNCTNLMILMGMCSYMYTVIPGSIGAGRKDRIPHYFRRSVALILIFMTPLFALQFFAGDLMMLAGVPAEIAPDISTYCKLMVITAILCTIEAHLEAIFVNLGYVRCASLNSFVTGVGVDVLCSYFFIYRWQMGVHGAGLAQIIIKFSRVSFWMILCVYFRLWDDIFFSPTNEPFLTREEFRVFLRLGIPNICRLFSSYLIFQLQLLGMTNIPGITQAQLAAGAIWVQSESALSAVQSGWLQVTRMRSLILLGKKDPGAKKAYVILCILSFLLVSATNVPLLLLSQNIASGVSNNPKVQKAFAGIVWMLVCHSQTRVCSVNASSLYIPLEKSLIGVSWTFFCFYIVAAPTAGILALSNAVPSLTVTQRMVACVSTSTIAQTLIALFGFVFLYRMDWDEAGKIVNSRAHTDKAGEPDVAEGVGSDSVLTSPLAAMRSPMLSPMGPMRQAAMLRSPMPVPRTNSPPSSGRRRAGRGAAGQLPPASGHATLRPKATRAVTMSPMHGRSPTSHSPV